jgi:hypothetical protein
MRVVLKKIYLLSSTQQQSGAKYSPVIENHLTIDVDEHEIDALFSKNIIHEDIIKKEDIEKEILAFL